ncbi:hypothetical protein HF086_014895 [Spodoptera exigua]|uniref:ATP-dependent DNA helicase n=1 Tax=Spodoptera exigua TaxID=7107 RepID=A0A922MKB8_SPOEX|nr:hypothetical protein HF086_014895 [Spodoptera exigua]
MWKANMDIQPCGTNESIAYYIAKYVSKSEPTNLDGEVSRAIQQIRREETDVSRKLFKICMRILRERQVSACECVFRLCHLSMRDSSRKTIFVNTRKAEQRYKVLKFNEAGQAAGYCANIFERYEKRPAEHPNYDFNNMCLIEFAMLFEPHYTKPPDINEESIDTDAYAPHEQTTRRRLITLTDNTKMTIRNTPAVVRVPNFVAASDPESYYYSLLIQYMPYRNETELLGEFNSARDAFLANEESLRQTNAYLEIYRERDRQLENAFAQVHAFQILEHAEPMELDHEEEVPYLPMNEDQFSQAKQSMNARQKEIFTLVTQSIQNQMSGAEERLRIFFTGGAGVGKTFLLKLLRDQINRCYAKDAVKVCSLTGVAARLINGATIHSTLKLPVQKDGRITGAPVFKQPEHLQPATHLWRLFTLCELTENMRQQGDHTFIDILNALRVGELTTQHFSILMGKLLQDTSDEFAIDKALRVYPTNQQVNDHNSAVLNLYRNNGARIYKIKAQDQLVHATRNADNVDIATIIPADINKTGGLPSELEIFVGAKVMLRSNIDVSKGLVNGAIGYINEIVWPQFRRTQMYATDVPSVRIDFAKDGVHLIHPKAIQFPANTLGGSLES